MAFDDENWRFPKELLRVVKARLHVSSDENTFSGISLVFADLEFPDINYAYDQTTAVKALRLHINFRLPITELGELSGLVLKPADVGLDETEDLGSIYLFGAHNPVEWRSIAFGETNDGGIDADIDLVLDFDHEDRIGGRVTLRKRVSLRLEWPSDLDEHPVELCVVLNPSKLQNPDADIRYRLPEILELRTEGRVSDGGYDYSTDLADPRLFFFLYAVDETDVLLVVKAMESIELLGNAPTKGTVVALEKGEDFVIRWPEDVGEILELPFYR